MVHKSRLTLLIATAILGASFPVARVDAQTQPVSTVDDEIEVKVPFTFQGLSPDISSVGTNCTVWADARRMPETTWLASGVAQTYVSLLSKQADGSIVNTQRSTYVFKRPASLSGKQGEVECKIVGIVGSHTLDFGSAATDPRFRVVGATTTIAKFTW